MKIAVRIRPLSVVEKARNPVEVVQPFHENIILFRPPARSALKVTSDGDIEETEQWFSFHRVFGPTCSQHHIYDTMVRPLLDDVFKGINASVLLYGPTGSGKTYTMFGTPSSPGIVPTLARDLYSALQNQEHRTELKMSFLEIYNERVRDLLALQQISLDVHMDHTGQAHIRNMSEHCPKDLQEFFHLLDRGSQKRVQAATGANEVSSRSHALLLLTIECQISNTEAGLLRRTSQITLVDLAGSERAAATENRGMRQKEGANINQSLLALGNVIQALSSGDSKFVNYRASRLTRLLKSCLGGNCKTVFIAALSPSVFTTEDSRNTLAYATRVMNIPVDAHVNETIVRRHITEYESAIRDLNTENHSLRQRISELEELLQKQSTQRAIHSENSPTAINPIDTSDHGENGLRDIGNQETGSSTPVVLQGGVGKSDQLNSIQDPFQELWTRMQYIKVQLEQAQRKVQNTDEAMDQQLEEKMRSVNQTIMKWIEQEHREGVNEVEPIAVVTAKQQIIDISRKKRTIAQNRVAAAKELATATKDLLAEHQVLPSGLPLAWKESFATLLNEMVMYSTRCFEAEQMSTYYFNRNRVLETRLEEARLSIQKYHQCAVERKTGARESNTMMSVDWVAAEGWAASSQQEDPMQMIRVFRDVLLRQGKPRPKSPRSRQSIRLDTLEVARKVVRAKNGSGTLGRGQPVEPVLGKFASSNVIARIRSADTTNAAIANLVKKHSSSNMSRLQRSCSVNAFTLNGLSGAANRSPSSLNIPVSGNVPSSVPSLFGSNHVTSPPQVQSPMNIRRSDSAASALPNCTLTNSALQNVLPSTLSTTKEHRVISPPLNNNHNSPIRTGSPKELGERRESRVKAITPLTPSKLRYVDPATRKATLKQ